MSAPIAYWNGRLLPQGEVSVAVDDVGFMMGATVAERMRTFGGKLFRWEPHLDRLKRSLEILRVDLGSTLNELTAATEQLVRHNHPLLEPGGELGVVLFVTPGVSGQGTPNVCIHSNPLPSFADLYDRGQDLIVSSIRQVPTNCWPAELKCRSRVHYYLADAEAAEKSPGARALLLDQDGNVCEASTANIVVHFSDRGLVSPPLDGILPGISLEVLAELAEDLGIPFDYSPLTVADLGKADEILLTSTSPCVWPVLRLDGRPVGSGRPGPIHRQLLKAWHGLVA